jgi:membrane-associated protein
VNSHTAITALNILDPRSILQSFGIFAVLVIMFAETGLLVGFFLPGDSLLFIAGVGASAVATQVVGVHLSLPALLVGAPICAIAGAQTGYLLGARYGRRLFDRPNSRFFKPENVQRAEYYFNRFGPVKAVVLARFVPVVRTFMNPVAGILEMPARRFFVVNVIGGVLWADGVILAGWVAATKLRDTVGAANIDTYILPAVGVIIVLSLVPLGVEIIRARRSRKRPAADVDPPTGRERDEAPERMG